MPTKRTIQRLKRQALVSIDIMSSYIEFPFLFNGVGVVMDLRIAKTRVRQLGVLRRLNLWILAVCMPKGMYTTASTSNSS